MTLRAQCIMGHQSALVPVVEVSDDFNRADSFPMDGSWAAVGTNRVSLEANRALGASSVSDTDLRHTSTLTLGSNFARVTNTKYGVALMLRGGATALDGYRAGRIYFNTPATSWRWAIRRDGVEVVNVLQVPFVDPGTFASLRLEVAEVGANVDVKLYVDDALAVSYNDASPLSDTGRVGVHADGRGSTARPEFDNFEAGRLE